MNLKKLFQLAMSKQDEVWNHSIIKTRADLKIWLAYERHKYAAELSSGGIFCLAEKDFIWKYQKRLRKTEYYLNSGKRIKYLISRYLLVRLSIRLGLNIRLNSCGKGLYIVHIASVITNGDIGEDYAAFPNTLVGSDTTGAIPLIGDHVIAYTGATIAGKIHIASNVKISANSFVNQSIDEENVIVAGVPAKIVSRKRISP